MKRLLFLILTVNLFWMPAISVIITPDMAEVNVANFVNTLGDASLVNPNVMSVMTINKSTDPSMPVLYVYNVYSRWNQSGKYVITAGVSGVRNILAYGDAPLDSANIPDGLQALIDWYQAQIEATVNEPVGEVLAMPHGHYDPSPADVEPLITTKWGQTTPFNLLMPEHEGKHCLTGCANTALSMIFHYHQYSNLVDNVPAYTTKQLNIEMQALEPTDFDWENMLDVYTPYVESGYTDIEAEAVARLMQYVGQAEKVDYTPWASAAYMHNICNAIERFGYSQTMLKKKDFDDEQQWCDILLNELQAERPVLYVAANESQSSSHAFIVDGYDAENNMYHINWGWSGDGNCHCVLNEFKATNSATVFSQDQIMIVDIKPADRAIEVDSTELLFNEFTGYQQTQTFTVKGVNLTQDVMLQVSDVDGLATYSVSPSVITPAEAAKGQTVTVEFTPWAGGSSSAELILSSDEIDSVAVNLFGEAIKAAATICVDSTTIFIQDEVSALPALTPIISMKHIDIPITIKRVMDEMMLCVPPADWFENEMEIESYCSYQLSGDSCYVLGMEAHPASYHELTLETPIKCYIRIWYRFKTLGQHNATLTIRSRHIVSRPVVVNLLGTAVLAEEALRIHGDVNGDGVVDVSDVTALNSYILGMDVVINEAAADMNFDGVIDVSDVTLLINYVLNGQ